MPYHIRNSKPLEKPGRLLGTQKRNIKQNVKRQATAGRFKRTQKETGNKITKKSAITEEAHHGLGQGENHHRRNEQTQKMYRAVLSIYYLIFL